MWDWISFGVGIIVGIFSLIGLFYLVISALDKL